jgi:hypothetical protein
MRRRSFTATLTLTFASTVGAVATLPGCSVSSPATEIREALARPAPIGVAAEGARIDLRRATFRDVEVAAEGGRARVLAVVDADGIVSLAGGEVALGYIGREDFEMARCASARWCATASPVPALAGVVEALAAAPREAGRRPVAWQIRVERDRATVGEDAAGPGGAPAPRRALDLVRDGARWRLAPPR